MTELRTVWQEIRDSIIRGPGMVVTDLRMRSTGVMFPAGEALVGMNIRGVRHLLIPLPEGTARHKDRGSRGVQLEVRDWIHDGAERLFLDVTCEIPELNDLFTVVAQDILDAGLEQPDDIVKAASATLDRWRQLLQKSNGSLMRLPQLAGLCGELLVLDRIASHHPGALGAWAGPSGGRHDFVSGQGDLEVKTTLSPGSSVVRIHGLGQLDHHESAPLYLVFCRLLHPTSEGVSVPELVERIISAGIPASELYGRLHEAGYDVALTEQYRTIRFELVELTLHPVDDGFPRLTPAELELPAAIQRIEYSLDLGHESCLPTDEAAVDDVFAAVANGAADP